jgi:hypothetical protein
MTQLSFDVAVEEASLMVSRGQTVAQRIVGMRDAGAAWKEIAIQLDAEGIRPSRDAAWSTEAVRSIGQSCHVAELPRLHRPCTAVRPALQPPDTVQPKAALAAAHDAVERAEAVLVTEEARPASTEHWQRMATAYEQRAAAWRLLAASWERDPSGHVIRAMELASESDRARAWMLRTRLAVAG